ncbi:hypothetical protein JYT28_01060 [Desulfobulbus sp. AH-315-M07]|nr:hypothetical protein [Desulfobulbus sp. AH-315-M07]
MVVIAPWMPFAPPIPPPAPPLPLPVINPCPTPNLPPAKPTNWIHIECPVTAGWTGGKGQHKFTSTCIHRGDRIALAGHDCGKNIIHVPAPFVPIDLLIPLPIMGSSRKSPMTTSLVKMDGAEVALSLPIPYQICSSLPLPICPVINALNTVQVGFSWGDFAIGLINVGVDVAVAFITSKMGPKGPASAMGELEGALGKPSLKTLVTAGGSLLKGIASYAIKGKGKASIDIGGPLGSGKIELELEYDEKTGKRKLTPSAETTRRTLPVGTERTTSVKRKPDGSWEYETKENTLLGNEKKETTKWDKDGKKTETYEESPLWGKDKKGTGTPPGGHETRDFPI